MKKLMQLASAMLVMMVVSLTVAFAQPAKMGQYYNQESIKGKINEYVQTLDTKLDLTDEQAKEIKKIFVEQAEQTNTMRKANPKASDKELLKLARPYNKEANTKVEAVLNDATKFAKYKKWKKAERDNQINMYIKRRDAGEK